MRTLRGTLCHHSLVVPALLALASTASPAAAASEPSARLVRCGEESCLRISGQRESSSASVRINGHAVRAEGRRNWEVHLPVETIRAWSPPHARTVEVSLHRADSPSAASTTVDLPIGLLGGVTDLASLVVSTG